MRPGLPLITALERSDSEVKLIQAALKEVIADKATQAARQALHITGLGLFSEFDYGPIATLGRR